MRTLLNIGLVLCASGCAWTSAVLGQSGSVRVIYYAPAWGPNEKNEEVVYFLKQVTFESGREQQNRIYLCSIKPDGSGRKEIAELWKDKRDQWLETYATAASMEVNAQTKRAAIGVEQGRKSGVFVVDLDGKNFHSLWPKEWNEDRPTTAGYPTWSPDGNWIACHEYRFENGFNRYRIAKMRRDGADYLPLTERNEVNFQPAWSPAGDLIAYVNDRIADPERNIHAVHLWLMKPDGSGKRDTKAWGRYPRWSPDGKFILHNANQVIDPTSLQRNQIYRPDLPMWPKWGKAGYISVGPNGMDFTTTDPRETRSLLANALRGAKGSGTIEEKLRW